MKNNVKVTAKEGKIFIASTKNPEFGYFRVESSNTSMENGWIQTSTRSALIRGKMADLTKLNLKEGQELAGKIIIKESNTPSYDGQPSKINPSTGEEMTHNGNPVYRESFFTTDANAQDELLANDKAEATVESPSTKAADAL